MDDVDNERSYVMQFGNISYYLLLASLHVFTLCVYQTLFFRVTCKNVIENVNPSVVYSVQFTSQSCKSPKEHNEVKNLNWRETDQLTMGVFHLQKISQNISVGNFRSERALSI